MKLLEEKIIIQLLDYIEKISYLRSLSNKDKEKDKGDIGLNITLLILSTKIAKLISPILLAYIQ